MATGIKKLQRVQLSKETVAGTAVPASAVWRGTGNQLDDQRTVNKVEEMVGILTDTTRTNVSKLLGAISLNSCTATYEQLPILFSAAFGGPVIGASDGGTGSGGVMTANLTGGVVTSLTINNGGAGYTTAPTLVLGGGSPVTAATATATVSGGIITAFTITGGGTGYVTAPKIAIIPNGAGSDGVYKVVLPSGVAPLPVNSSYTIMGGDNFEVEQLNYAVCTKIELSGDAGGEVKVSADFLGQQVAYSGATFPGTSVFPFPVEDILFQKGKVFLDAIGGAYGNTQVSNAIVGFKVTFEIKWSPVFTSDNALTYSFSNFTGYDVKGELTYIHDTGVSGSGGAKDFYRTQTHKLLELRFTGAALATPGVAYSNKQLIIDLPLTFMKASPLGDKDGTSVVTMSFDAGYDPSAAIPSGQVIVVSEQRFLTGVTP